MNRVFFTADTHFGHGKILQHCERPYPNAEEMDRDMVRIWNETVGVADTVYHLGDFSLKGTAFVRPLLRQLHGRKILVRGNHDRSGVADGWDAVHDMLLIDTNDGPAFLCHYPLREWPQQWRGAVHLYGHVHGSLYPEPGSMDVGWDVWGKPVTIEDIRDRMRPFSANLAKQGRIRLRFH